MTKDELMEALMVERYDNRWWNNGPEPSRPVETAVFADLPLDVVRRRRVIDEAMEEAG